MCVLACKVDEEETNKGFAMTKVCVNADRPHHAPHPPHASPTRPAPPLVSHHVLIAYHTVRAQAMFAEGWARAGDEALGSAALGPPFTEPTGAGWPTSKEPKNKADMVALANKLNPVVGFWDPLQIIKDDTPPEQIGWWRHAEIKHGRIAMAAFVGYTAHANGIHFPWSIQEPLKLWGSESPLASLPSITFADIAAAGSPGDMWDAVPTAGKAQIFAVIAFLEAFGETSVALEADGQKHYVRGGKPVRARLLVTYSGVTTFLSCDHLLIMSVAASRCADPLAARSMPLPLPRLP